MKKKFLLLVVTLFVCSSFAFGAAACDLGSSSESSSSSEGASSEETIERESVESQGLVYELLDDDTYQVKGIGTCTDKEMGIPSTYKGKAVTSIADYAFAGNTRLTGVEIPDSIKSIGASAFGACSKLKNIYITSMEAWCNIEFAYNANPLPYVDKLYLNNVLVANLKIPDSVTTIGENAFMMYNKLESVEMGNGVTTIGKSAFSSCANLTSVTLGENVTTIGENAFSVCTALQFKEYGNAKYLGSKTNAYFALIETKSKTFDSYKIHDDTKLIADNAFSNCRSMEEIDIPDGVTSIGEKAFAGCWLRKVYIKDIAAWCNISFGDFSANPLGDESEFYLNDTVLTELIIPDGTTCIGDYAFKGCKSLTSVVIPDSVTSIGDYAFSNCTNLASITIASGVTSIGDHAFFGCKTLSSITLASGVTSIGNHAFHDCYRLKSIVIPDSVTSIGDYAFHSCQRMQSITMGKGVTTIGDYAFYFCDGLESIELPDGLISIGKSAFQYCDFKEIIIPDSVSSIGDQAFESCDSLKITIGKGLTFIGEKAFDGCDYLESITVSEDNAVYASQDRILYNKAKTEIILVPKNVAGAVKIVDGITTIDNAMFSKRSNLTSLEIPSSVTSIGEDAFNGCTHLASITVSEDNTAYASQDGILYNKAKTEIISIPKGITGTVEIASGITSISDQMFYERYGLTSVVLPNGVTSIGVEAFYYCSNLTSIEIPDSVTSIGVYAFYSCKDLTSVTFGNGLTSIGNFAFQNCTSLTSIEIPDSGVAIGGSAFENCTSLAGVTIPDSVVSIGYEAFSNCDNLQFNEYENAKYLKSTTNDYFALMEIKDKNASSFTFLSDTKIIAGGAFEDCAKLTSVEIPEGIRSIEGSAFGKCTGLTSVVIPDTVSFISTFAFYSCWNLKDVTCPTFALSCFEKGELERVVFTSGDSLPDYALSSVSRLISVTIPKSVTSIGAYAFQDCQRLTIYCEAESQPNSWNSTWNSCRWDDSSCPVVWDCKNNDVATDGYIYVILDGVRYALKDGVATVVMQSTGIKTAIISESITYKEIEYPVTSIVDSAFYYCSNMKKVVIPNSVISIGDEAFSCCESLTEIVIPNGVTSIGKKALYNCHYLVSVVIPDSVKSIGENAFDQSWRVDNVYYLGTAEDWAEIEIASGNDNLTSATVYYYIEKEEDVPTDGGNYWHYDENDAPVAWITNEEL